VQQRIDTGACGAHRRRFAQVSRTPVHVQTVQDLGLAIRQFEHARPHARRVQMLCNVIAKKATCAG